MSAEILRLHLFTAEGHRRAASGEITVTYRLWASPHVKAGKTYSTGFGGCYIIEDVRLVRAADIPAADLPLTGHGDHASLLARAAEHTGGRITAETRLYRVLFRYGLEAPLAKAPLSVEVIRRRLERFDNASRRGPWTMAILRLIAENPRTLARILARELDWDTPDFKVHVRKLKALGLTLSHAVGYELSELGQAYIDSAREP